MATPPSLTQIAFAAGLDESQQDEVLDPMASFPVIRNGRQDRVGGLLKRLGYASLSRTRSDTTSRASGNRLLSHEGLTCTVDGTNFDAYTESASTNVIASRVPEASVTSRTLSTVTSTLVDVAICGNYIATLTTRTATVGGTSSRFVVGIETIDGVVMRAPEVMLSSASAITGCGALGSSGAYFFLLVAVASSANVALYCLDTSTIAGITSGWFSVGNVVTDKSNATIFVDSLPSGSGVVIAYKNNSGGTSRVSVKRLNSMGAVDSTTINTNSTNPSGITIESSGSTVWVAWGEATNINVIGLSPSLLSSITSTKATLITPPGGTSFELGLVAGAVAGSGRLLVQVGIDLSMRGWVTTAGAVTADTLTTTVCDVQMASRSLLFGGRYYGLFRSSFGVDNTTVLCDWSDVVVSGVVTNTTQPWFRPVAMAYPSLTDVTPSQMHSISLSSTSFAFATSVLRSSVGHSVELLTYDFADSGRWRSASHNKSLFLSGGILSYFDGRRVSEAGFLHRPSIQSAVDSGAGTGPTGTYRYVATFEDVDDDGNWVLSGVSSPTGSLSITNKTVTVVVSPLTITSRLLPYVANVSQSVRVCLYRTLTGAAAPYYFVDSAEFTPTSTVTFSDANADASISVNRLLYGTGNLPGTNNAAQDRRVPPFCSDVISYNGMLVVASGTDIWWSGQTVSGEHTWFSPVFSQAMQDDSVVTALAAQDGTLFVFKRRSIYSIAGEAPSDNGSSGGLGTPRRLACDVGCIDPNSIISTSLGVFFQSDRGIELLSRGGEVTWIGRQIQRSLASYPIVSSATLDSKNGLVRFSVATSRSSGRVSGVGRDLVYDLFLGSWLSVDDKTGSSAAEASQDASMVYVGGAWRYGWLGTDGTVYYERLSTDASAYLDGSTWVTLAVETGSFKAGGIQGRQQLNHVLALARKSTDFDLAVSLSYNYEASFRTARTFSHTEITNLLSAGWPITQLKHEPHDDGDGEAVRVRIADATPTSGTVGSGKGATLIALTLDITPKPGVFDVPEGAT